MTAAAALLAAGAAWAAQNVSHCPEGSRPSRTLEQRRPWACVLDSERYQDGVDCPAGTRAVTTPEAASPFKCAREDVTLTAPRGICPPGETAIPSDDPDKPYACEPVGKSFMGGPRCPKGTRPVPTPGQMQSFRCTAEPKGADPAPAARPDFAPPPGKEKAVVKPAAPGKPVNCPQGTRRVVTENPFEPVQCLPEEESDAKPLAYRPFKVSGAVSFDVPRGWNVTDAWKDAEPAVYVMADRGRDGRPVSLTVTRSRRGQAGYVDLETRIWQEEDWHAAKEVSRSREGGRLSIHLEAPGESRLTLVSAPDGYFALSYGAPAELYPRYLPAFERLVKSFKSLEGR
ncbi:hypothetical protein EPO15_17655 [bacterium]|nr:MAG: hypothetical protein EPO15_17655 [bacterium]